MVEQTEPFASSTLVAHLPPQTEVTRFVGKYAKADNAVAWIELLKTAIAVFVIFYFATLPSISMKQLMGIAILYGLLKVRMFVLHHDCAHDNFFSQSSYNNVLGTLLGSSVLTSFSSWRKSHLYHHRKVNDHEDEEAMSQQTAPWTIEQFQKASTSGKLLYCFIYGPLTYQFIIPFVDFLIFMRKKASLLENILVILYYTIICYFFHCQWAKIIMFEVIGIAVAGSIGYNLFHVQHTFDGVYRGKLSFYENGMLGSSHLQVPFPFSFFTQRIEFHHIHHLNARVPSYRLKECHDANPELFTAVTVLPFSELFTSINKNLYNPIDRTFSSCYAVWWRQWRSKEKR